MDMWKLHKQNRLGIVNIPSLFWESWLGGILINVYTYGIGCSDSYLEALAI